ncbi:tetratricopeptide repeat protein [Candidatus Uabimicrobium sp. HlEnr_7]|uniref:tetratricopeptide repeat protein n=1 Tax=Candidatus Uabimicrobium helgolandensis TaxID=3095367 RepID=UPI003557ADCA
MENEQVVHELIGYVVSRLFEGEEVGAIEKFLVEQGIPKDVSEKIVQSGLDHFGDIKEQLKHFEEVDELYKAEKWQEVVLTMHKLTSPSFMRQLSDLRELLKRLDMALDAAHKTGDPKLLAMTQGNLGNVYNQAGENQRALECFQNAYDYGKASGDLQWQAQGLNFLATTYMRMEKYDEAIKSQEESVEISRKLENPEMLAYSISVLGDVHLMYCQENTENVAKTIEVYEEAITLFLKLELEDHLAQPYTNVGSAYAMVGEYQKAVDYIEKSIAIKIKQNDLYGLVVSLRNVTDIYHTLKDHKNALASLEKLVGLKEKINITSLLPEVLTRRAYYYLEKGLHDKSIEDYKVVIESNPKDVAVVYYGLARSYAAKKENKQALDTLQKALEKGFNDFKLLEEDEYISIIKDDPQYQDLISKYVKK